MFYLLFFFLIINSKYNDINNDKEKKKYDVVLHLQYKKNVCKKTNIRICNENGWIKFNKKCAHCELFIVFLNLYWIF